MKFLLIAAILVAAAFLMANPDTVGMGRKKLQLSGGGMVRLGDGARRQVRAPRRSIFAETLPDLETYPGRLEAISRHFEKDPAKTRENMTTAIQACVDRPIPEELLTQLVRLIRAVADVTQLPVDEQRDALQEKLIVIATEANIWALKQTPELQSFALEVIQDWVQNPDEMLECQVEWLREEQVNL